MHCRSLLPFRKNVYSQNGEDGVTAELLRRWGISKGWFCEFGAWDGKYGSNTYALLKKGWSGLMIEGDEKRFQALERTARSFPDTLYIEQAYVDHEEGPNSLDSLLAKTPIPNDFEVLSIDIDGNDYWVWKSLQNYRPRLVIIEIDSSTLPGEEYIHCGEDRLTSFSAMLQLGQKKDYTLICHTGNLFFVASEHLASLKLDTELLNDPCEQFITDWVSPNRFQVFIRKIRNMTWQRALVKIENAVRNKI